MIKRKTELYLIPLIIIYLILYTFNLEKYPHLWGDEAFFCNPAYTLATKGVFGTEFLQGWFNIENNTFWQPPVYMLSLALSFKILGFGIIQARIVSIIFGLISLIFTYKIAEKLYNEKIGILAVALLMFNPVMFLGARNARMEIAVTAFVLISIYLLITGLENHSNYYFLLSGVFGGLAILSHPNALHIVVVIGILLLFVIRNKNTFKQFTLFSGGTFLIGIPYLIYILSDISNFHSQFSANIAHYGLIFWHNIQVEPQRYINYINLYGDTLVGSIIPGWFFIKLILLGGLISYAVYYTLKRREYSDKIILTYIIVWCLFIALFTNYNVLYFCIVTPFVSIMLAGIFYKKEKIKNQKLGRHIHKIATILLLGFLVVNALYCPALLYSTRNYDYYQVTDEIRNIIPENSTVIGPAELWFGMYDYKFYAYQCADLRVRSGEEFYDVLRDLFPEYSVLGKDDWTVPGIADEISEFTEQKCVKIVVITQKDNPVSYTIYKIKEI